MENNDTVKTPKPLWAKVFIALSIIIILGVNILAFILILAGQTGCSDNDAQDPYYNEALTEELNSVFEGEDGKMYEIGVDYYGPVRDKSQINGDDYGETVLYSLGAAAIVMFIPNVLMIVFAVNLYKGIKKTKEGGSGKGNFIVSFIIAAITIFAAIIIIFGVRAYLVKARAATTEIRVHAPVIYIYSESETPVNVQLDLNGEFTFTYPRYIENRGWDVTATPDGTLTDKNGNKYDFLFWQADMRFYHDLSRGYCVPGDRTEEFLYEAAYELGLNEKEAAAFVGYWIPYMRDNPYNVITFQTDNFDEAARLNISPEPDVMLRVNMLWYPSDEYVQIKAQDLSAIGLPLSERHGLTVVEWGGEILGE